MLDVRLVDVPSRGHTAFLNLPSAVLALIFIAKTIQLFLSLVDRELGIFRVLPIKSFSTWALNIYIYISRRKTPVCLCDDTEIRTQLLRGNYVTTTPHATVATLTCL